MSDSRYGFTTEEGAKIRRAINEGIRFKLGSRYDIYVDWPTIGDSLTVKIVVDKVDENGHLVPMAWRYLDKCLDHPEIKAEWLHGTVKMESGTFTIEGWHATDPSPIMLKSKIGNVWGGLKPGQLARLVEKCGIELFK